MRPKNFAQIDDRVWRGARPDLDEANGLVNAGVKTVINLEWEHGDDSAFDETTDDQVRLLRLLDWEPLPWFAPSIADQHIIRALAEIRVGPSIIYVHCRSGQNRTGVVIAAYRILERGDPAHIVLANFRSYRGFWAWGDSIYIRGLSIRREAFLKRITCEEERLR